MIKSIRKTENGHLFQCNSCLGVYLEFNNLAFSFDSEEFSSFAKYVHSVDGDYLEKAFTRSPYIRKIALSVKHKNVKILLNRDELEELKILTGSLLEGEREIEIRSLGAVICNN